MSTGFTSETARAAWQMRQQYRQERIANPIEAEMAPWRDLYPWNQPRLVWHPAEREE